MSDCLFCKIASGKISSEKVFENERILAFKDINPQAPVHILVIPKAHYDSLSALDEESAPIVSEIALVIKRLAEEYSLGTGYRVITNIGDNGGQTVHHLHFHILGGVKLSEKMC